MESKEKLPPGWIKVKSKSRAGKVYYYNNETKESVWEISDLRRSPEKCKMKLVSPKKVGGVSSKSVTIGKKNIAENRMKNLKMAMQKEINTMTESEIKPKQINNNKPIAKVPQKSSNFKCLEKKPTISPRKQKDPASIEKKKLVSPRKRVEEKDRLQPIESMDVDMTSSQETNSNNPAVYFEPMDWEEIDIEEVVKEVTNIRQVKSIPSSLMPHDFTDTKNDDVLYIVVDTNIFCSNPHFIERIKGKMFKEIGKACIYIPYVVLCELDMLKTREGNISKAAQRGIKTINSYFSTKDNFVVGQSINEDSREVIPIDSGDDKILNCAFQLKQVTDKILLLSNDINLRNKAFVNGFEAYSIDMLNYADFNTTKTINFE